MAFGESRLDGRLGGAKQIKRGIEFIFIDMAEIEHGPQRMDGRLGAQLPGCCELGRGLDHPRDDEGQGELGKPLRLARQKSIKPELVSHAKDGGDMAMRRRALDLDTVGRRDQLLILEEAPQGIDLGVRPMREIGERARLHLVALAIAFAQQDGRWRIAIRDASDEHGQENHSSRRVASKINQLHAYINSQIHPSSRQFKPL